MLAATSTLIPTLASHTHSCYWCHRSVLLPSSPLENEPVGAARASRVLPPAGLAMDSRNRVDMGSRAPSYECTSSVVRGTVVHQPALAVGNPGNAVLPASDQSGRAILLQRARTPACRTVLPSYSRYAINYSIERFAGYYGLYFGQSSVGQCKHRYWFSWRPSLLSACNTPVQTLSFLLRRQSYAPSLQTLA
jgi:hypothetical protein